jgi:polysaccharide pyruvyl transferase WcaK-like protein
LRPRTLSDNFTDRLHPPGVSAGGRRFALLSPSGWGNLGDAAIVQALIHGIRRRVPDAELYGLTLNPEDSEKRHGIPTLTCSGISLDGYGVREPRVGRSAPGPADAGASPDAGAASAGGARRRASAMRATVRRRLSQVPGAERAWQLAARVRSEVRHRLRTGRILGRLDSLIVAGGGQIDEHWGGPLGHPYVLWRWGRFARSRGARYLVLSVGTGTVSSGLGRRFVRQALALAEYRSYRDAESRALVADIGFDRDDPVVPDLAFSFPVPSGAPPARAPGAPPVVAISPIAYNDPRIWPRAEPARYRRHVEQLAALIEGTVRRGWDVSLFATDWADRVTIREVLAELDARARLRPEDRRRIRASEIDTVDDVFRLLREVDLVVAARLHGVLLSLVAGRPVLALSYDRKVARQMADAGQSEFCMDIDRFDPDDGQRRLQRLWERRGDAGAEIAAVAGAARRRVEEQYDLLFGAPRPEAPAPAAGAG